MTDKTITITLSTDEARRIVNGLHLLLIVLADDRDFPDLEYAQEIMSEWLLAKYKDDEEEACEVIKALWRLNHVLLERIEKTGEPLLSEDEISSRDALEVVKRKKGVRP